MAEVRLQPIRIGVIGAGRCDPPLYQVAYDTGRIIASRGGILICGGLGGVMEGAAKGAFEQGGTTVGLLPTSFTSDANPYITIPLATGLGHARNILVVQSSQIVIAIGGAAGTLSEIAIALKIGIPIIGYETWHVDRRITIASSPSELTKLLENALETL